MYRIALPGDSSWLHWLLPINKGEEPVGAYGHTLISFFFSNTPYSHCPGAVSTVTFLMVIYLNLQGTSALATVSQGRAQGVQPGGAIYYRCDTCMWRLVTTVTILLRVPPIKHSLGSINTPFLGLQGWWYREILRTTKYRVRQLQLTNNALYKYSDSVQMQEPSYSATQSRSNTT